MKLSLLSLLASVVLATTAQATTTLTTSVGFGLNGVTCFTLNTSTKPVEVESVTFVSPDGVTYSGQTSTCSYPGLVSPGLACRDSVDIGTAANYVRCVIVTKGNSKSIRGSMLLRDNQGTQSILEAR
jgi:hypothetical protein